MKTGTGLSVRSLFLLLLLSLLFGADERDMRNLQNQKSVIVADVASASTLTGSVDTQGFRFARVEFSSSSTGIMTTNTKIEQSDDNSTWEAIPGLVRGTDYSLSAVTNSTTKPKIVWNVEMLGKKRYLKVTVEHATAGRGRFHATLSVPADGIDTADASGTDTLAIG